MSSVTIYHEGTETTIEDPAFVDTLCNLNEVAVDGQTFSKVEQVTYNE